MAALGVATAALFVWELATAPPFEIDDAYITFEFAKNFARGHGPTYGQGLRVEGYSNFLWMALVAGPLAVVRDADPLRVARALIMPFAALLLGSTYLLARLRAGWPWAAGAALLLALHLDVILALLSGLETLPYVALVTTGFCLYAHRDRSPLAHRLTIPVLTAAALTRIDGFAPLAFVIAYEVLSACLERRFSLRVLLRWALPGVALWVLWFAWRWWYYGMPLPATYYAKALIPQLLPRRGVEYVRDEILASGLYLAVPAMLLLAWRRVRAAVPLAMFALLHLGYVARVGGDWMPFGRFVLPAVPLLFVMMAWGAQEAYTLGRLRGRALAGVAAVVAGATFLFVAWRIEPHVARSRYARDKLGLAVNQFHHVASLKKASRYLSAVVPSGGRMVTDYGGVLAYFTKATPIEMWGLCNATIARRGHTRGINPIYGRTCPECYPELDPEFFHTVQPLVRAPDAFTSHHDVVNAVWQTDEIGRHLDVLGGFATGRVSDLARGEALYFLERRKPEGQLQPRWVDGGLLVEYPFEPAGVMDPSVRSP